MNRRFSKSESNSAPVLPTTKRLAALFCASSLLAFSATSCDLIEMRDATSEITSREETTAPTLQQAQKYSEVETMEVSGTETASAETEAAPEENENKITLTAAGGIVVDTAICQDGALRAVEGKDYSFLTMFSGIYPLVQNADVSVATLNSPAADTAIYGLSTEEYYNMPAEAVTAMTELGFDVLNAAGQNRLDCGIGGLKSTVDTICNAGVLQIGAYRDDIDAGDVRVMEVNGIKVSFVSFTESATETDDELIVHDLTDRAAAESLITYADLVSDVVVVSVNWDNGTAAALRAEQKDAAMMLTEAGADVIVGSNGACLQTAEWITAEDGSKTFVAYSLGNLLSTGTDAATSLGGLLTLDIVPEEDGTVQLENVQIIPIVSHYTADMTGYQTAELTRYTEDQAVLHGIEDLTAASMYSVVRSTIPADYLPDAILG